jgi:MFS family permease
VAEQGPAIADRTLIFALLGAEAVSQVGNTMTIVARPWFVLQTTGSAAKTGLVMAALVLGSVLPAVVGGPLVYRLGFKHTSVFADLASVATVASVPLLYLAGILTFWQLLVLVFVLSSINTQGDTARYALLPALARRGAMSIERANAADRAVVRVGALVGPLVAGVLIALVGAVNVLFVEAATFSASATLVALGVSARAGAGRRSRQQTNGAMRPTWRSACPPPRAAARRWRPKPGVATSPSFSRVCASCVLTSLHAC